MLPPFGHEQYMSEIRPWGQNAPPTSTSKSKAVSLVGETSASSNPVGREASMGKYTWGVWGEGEVEAPGSGLSLVPTALTKC